MREMKINGAVRIAIAAALLLGIVGVSIVVASQTGSRPPVDNYGDPLPPLAVHRLGTQRLRHGAIAALSWSPDGKVVASAAGNGFVNSVRVWDAVTGKMVGQVVHSFAAHSVALSPDGKLAVSIDQRGGLFVWEQPAGYVLKGRLMAPNAPV